MNRPVLNFCDKMDEQKALVDPLPLVPATWIAFSLFKSVTE